MHRHHEQQTELLDGRDKRCLFGNMAIECTEKDTIFLNSVKRYSIITNNQGCTTRIVVHVYVCLHT